MGKYNLLVDEISDKRNFGIAKDIEKIKHNQRILGEDFKNTIAIQKLFTDNGLTSVFPVGRFITVLEISKDGSLGTMTFFDFDIEVKEKGIRELLIARFSESIVSEWFNIYEQLSSDFSEEDDLFSLSLSKFS